MNPTPYDKAQEYLASVSANDLAKPVTPITVPQPQVAEIPKRQSQLVNNITRDTNGFITAQTEQAKQLQEVQNQYAALNQGGTLSDLFKSTQADYGVDSATFKELKDIQLQLNDMNTESDVRKVKIAGAAGQTLGQAGREVTQEDRENAVRSSGLAARAAVLQGNIQTAIAAAKDAVSIAYQDRTLQSQNLIKQIEMLQGRVDEQTAQMLEQEKRNYEADIAKVEELKSAVSEAMVSGASQNEIAQLTDPNMSDEQKLALAQSITARGANEMRDLDITSKNLDIASKRSSIYTSQLQQQKLLAELNPDNTSDNDAIIAYAQQFMETGKLPNVSEMKAAGITASQITEYAKQAPKQDGQILSASTGIKPSSLSSAQEDGIASLYDITQKVAQLKELDQQRQQGLTSALTGKVFGSEDQQRYLDLRQEIIDLLARARTGAALTASEEKFYADQLPGRVGQSFVIPGTDKGLFGVSTQSRLDNFESKIKGTLDTKLSASGAVIHGYSTIEIPSLGEYKVGDILDIGGEQYRVLPDGTLTDII